MVAELYVIRQGWIAESVRWRSSPHQWGVLLQQALLFIFIERLIQTTMSFHLA